MELSLVQIAILNVGSLLTRLNSYQLSQPLCVAQAVRTHSDCAAMAVFDLSFGEIYTQ